MRVVIAGGGTAGHVYPGLALAGVLRAQGHDVGFVGTDRGLEATLVPAAGFDFFAAPAAPLVRSVSLRTARAPFVALGAVRRCRRAVAGASAVVGMGGYVSVPAVLAARRERIPVVIHEQNALPGLANRALARFARVVAVSFDETRGRFEGRRARVEVTGNPVRAEILAVREDRERLRKEALVEFGLDDDRRSVVVFGGSQGALSVNRAAAGASELLADRADLQILLITGPAHLDAVRRGLPEGGPGKLLVRTVGYVARMELAFAVADLVVSRSGATTVAELSVCGLPAVLIPYPHATGNHQEVNARALQRAGGAAMLLDAEVTADTVAEKILALLDGAGALGDMAARSAASGRPDAAEALAEVVAGVAG